MVGKLVIVDNHIFFIKPKVKYKNHTNIQLFVYLNVFGETFDKNNWKILNDIELSRKLYDIIMTMYVVTENQKKTIQKLVMEYLENRIPVLNDIFDIEVWNIINILGVLLNEYGLLRLSYQDLVNLTPLEFEVAVELQRKAIEKVNQRLKR